MTWMGALLSLISAAGLIAAVVIYGELTSLFVQRHNAAPTTPHAVILQTFGGGTLLPGGNRSAHMDALVTDSLAFGAASIAIMCVQFAAAALAVSLTNHAAGRMVARLRWQLLHSVLSQEIAFFDTNTNMDFASTLTEGIEKLRAGVGEHVAMTAHLAGSVILGASLALSYGWQLTLAGGSLVPVAVLVAAVNARYQTRCAARESSAYGTAGRGVEEALAAVRTVRAYAGEKTELDRYSAALQPVQAASMRRGLGAGLGAGGSWLLTYAINAVVLAYGAELCVRDMQLPPEQQEYHPGVMLTILFCVFMSAQNIAMCHPHLEVFSAARGAAKGLFPLLDRRSNINAMLDEGEKLETLRGDVDFENIYFNYPSRPDVKVLRGLSLSVKAGETVALVGSSGCGKSTLLQLLQALYRPDAGTVRIDGRPLDQLHLAHYRKMIGVVGQEPVLFEGSIRENISLGVRATHEQVVRAATVAHAHGFISKLADGYDTWLGSGGAALSGGQKQRIAIARALVRDPKVLLLDEPTSALDPAAERQVQAALDAAGVGRTTIAVSHRLSTIRNASRIVYVEQGAVLEQGTHEELLARQGAYARLLQDDITHKSIRELPVVEQAEEEEEFEPPPMEFRRPYTRSGSALSRQSIRESLIRSSRRVGSLSTPQLPPTEELDPMADEEDSPPPASTWSILKLNSPEWPQLLGGAIASLLVGATMPVFALLLSKLYGMFSYSEGSLILSQARLFASLFAVVAALCGGAVLLQTWLFNAAGAKLTRRLRERTFDNYLKQEQGWYDLPANSVGALCARLSSECAAVQGAGGTRLGTALQSASTMAIGVVLAMAYSWKMTLVSLLSVPCVIGGICLEGYVTRRTEQKERRALEGAARIATDAVRHVRTVHSLGVEQEFLSRYSLALDEASRSSAKAARVRGPVYGLCLCAPTLGYAVALAYGGYLVAREGLHYEYAILVAESLIYGAWMLAEALSFAPNFAAARRAAARITRALEREPKVKTETTAKEEDGWKSSGDLTFSSLHFRYPTRPTAPVLRGLTIKLEAGKTLALVGDSGCGKSTVMQLLLRNYDADEGRVQLDGRDTRKDLTLKSLRSQLGLVQQEPALLARSIRDNIAYGDTGRQVPFDEVVKAAKMANVHQFVAALPNGYDTMLGTAGAALSGGQKQRIAIARALVREPRVLLLDEATSALDANSEKAVQASLLEASRSRSTLIIAHRLATVAHADCIALIDKGVVAESGTHEELVRRRGMYWKLLEQQGHT